MILIGQIKKKLFLILLIFNSFISFNQKNNQIAQNSLLDQSYTHYSNYLSAYSNGEYKFAKRSILEAKKLIDIVSDYDNIFGTPKYLFYKAEIYSGLYSLRFLNDIDFNNSTPIDAIDQSIKSYSELYYNFDEYDTRVKISTMVLRGREYLSGYNFLTNQDFENSKKCFLNACNFSSILNEIDTVAYFYLGTCEEKIGEYSNAAEFYLKCATLGYKPELTYSAAEINLVKVGENEDAMTFLQEQIKKSPKDKVLYYALGTIAMKLNKDEIVLENLNKAIEFDPNFIHAHYNLGVYFFEKGNKLDAEAVALPPSEKQKIEELNAKSLEFYNLAAAPLEKYLESNPKDAEVLKSLSQVFRALKNTEKALEYKKRLDETK